MGIEIKRVAPEVPPRLPIDEIVVRNDMMPSSNTLVVSAHNVTPTFTGMVRNGEYSLRRRGGDGLAHLCFVQGHGLYLAPASLRQLGADLVELADQMEAKR